MALINVQKLKISCPICEKNDWCMVSEDYKLALCQRVANEHPNKKGGWWHSLEKTIQYDPKKIKRRKVEKRVPDYLLDRCYREFLSLLDLSQEHEEKLLKRGITADEISFYEYKTLPLEGRYKLTKSLLDKIPEWTLERTPGFFKKKGKYGEFWTFTGSTGFIIPINNIDKHTVGLQIRLDQPTKDMKYVWFSSNGKEGGASSGTPFHVSYPKIRSSDDIWVTEGPLKANIVSSRLGSICIAAAGVSNWSEIPSAVQKLTHRYHLKGSVIIAYDADYTTNSYVKNHANNLKIKLEDIPSISPIFATWDLSNGKGIDDVIINNSNKTSKIAFTTDI